MQIIYIVLAVLLAVFIAVFHYAKSLKQQEKVSYILAFLRFVAFLSLFLIIINPEIEQNKIEVEKSSLVVAIDNSSSMKQTERTEEIIGFVEALKSNTDLNTKFDLNFFQFGKQIQTLDSLSFSENGTDLAKPFTQFKSIYKDKSAPVILISDGNQTAGFSFEHVKSNQPVYPIIVGDTIKPIDLKIAQLNVNKYAYLKNKFPVEVYVNYNGIAEVKAKFSITKGNTEVYRAILNFSESENSQQITTHLLASAVGVQAYKAQVEIIEAEENTVNNSKDFVVEVIDEQSKILLLSSFLHPDVGSLKESIETNKQRLVEIKMIGDPFNIEEFDIVLLYQPNRQFKPVFETLYKQKINHFIITGTKTDWYFLNGIQADFSKKIVNQTEQYSAKFNPSFGDFSQVDIGFESFPPLEDMFGEVSFKTSYNALLWQQIGNFQLETPMLSTFENNGMRTVVLFGENFWRWRMISHVETQSFMDYDNFTAKLMQYLSASKRVKRLTAESASIYYSNDAVRIEASYLNKNYEFESNANLWIDLTHTKTKETKRFPFSLRTNSYSVELSDLQEGDYNYVVGVEDQKERVKGSFRFINFDVEQQFSFTDVEKLSAFSEKAQGKIYHLKNSDVLIQNLLENKVYTPIQRTYKKIESLIEWKWLLGLIILSLSIEWFIRKYKGLI